MSVVLMFVGDMVVIVLDASDASDSRDFTSSKVSNCSIMKRAEACGGPPVGGEKDEDRMMNVSSIKLTKNKGRDRHVVVVLVHVHMLLEFWD